jgi:hypothetical protein
MSSPRRERSAGVIDSRGVGAVHSSRVLWGWGQVAAIEDIIRRAEQGDLKLRVRVLESERAFQRLDIVQSAMANAILASMFLNAGILVTATAPAAGLVKNVALASRTLFAMATFFGVQVPLNYVKLRKFDKNSQELGLRRVAV